jgi:transposase-like protein
MDANGHKVPLARIMTVAEFHQRFGTQEACVEHLRKVRWGEGLERFVCPACGHTQGWWLGKRELVQCCHCRHQTSVTAGTVFHRVRSPLWKWFWAMYGLAQDKKGVGAIELAKQVGVSYTTGWLMLHKLRAAMRKRGERYALQGLVEVDECYVGGEADDGTTGRGASGKTVVAVAVELQPDGRPGHIALEPVARVDARCLTKFAQKRIAPGSTLKTDGWSAYAGVAKAGYKHRPKVAGSGKAAVEKFPWVHTFISNMKRMLLGTYHSVKPKHLDHYLAEFEYRANRRLREAGLFDRLLVAALDVKAVTYKELVGGDS